MLFLKKIFGHKPYPNALNKDVAVPVLCYHSAIAEGSLYEMNDHVALAHDLETLFRLGYQLLPPLILAKALRNEMPVPTGDFVCITFDDAPDLDYFDYHHAKAGLVKSMHGILEASRFAGKNRFVENHALTVGFVIASPDARQQFVEKIFHKENLIRDCWWAECAEKKIIGIGNHSWDHTHEAVEPVCQENNIKGSFHAIQTYQDADGQIRKAQDYIDEKTKGRSTPLFAYPYGHASSYLVEEYFPRCQNRHRQIAAFGTGGGPVTRSTNIWNIPRFVHGEHWRTPEDFQKLLKGAML